jgi:predicted membrane-bound spermidine synthase
LELAVALAGLVVTHLALAVPNVDAALFGDLSSGVMRALTRFLVAVLVLGVPTTLMGATLPILAKAVTERIGTIGREVGTLYAINIGGAVLGAACAGFWWIPSLGRSGANAIAVGIDLLVGATAIYFGMRQPSVAVKAVDPLAGSRSIRTGARDIVAVLALTGASAMALQVLWTRAISTALGPSTYAFSAIVCVYLAGLGLGGALASRIADGTRALRFALACVLLATALASMMGIAIVDDLPPMLRWVILDHGLTLGGLFATEFGLAGLCLLPATIAMGAIFPLSITAVVASSEKLGSAVGIAYAVNTVGAIAGSFASVFVLIPAFGIERGMRVAAFAGALGALGVADARLRVDATDPLAVLAAAEGAGGRFDLVVSCASVPGTEMAAILAAKDGGTVIFFSMATSFTAAALGAEGVGKDVTMLVGNGYAPGHAELTLDLLRRHPRLRALFEQRYAR